MDSLGQIWGEDVTGRSCVVAKVDPKIYQSVIEPKCKSISTSGYKWYKNPD